jgi:sugar transferase (PEP-CTERM system associated)
MVRIGGQRVPGRTILLVLLDISLISVGLATAIFLRFGDFHYFHQHFVVYRFLWVIFVCVLSLYYNDLYNPKVVRSRGELFVRTLQALGAACLGLAILYYFYPDHSLGRGIAMLAAPTILLLLLGSRLLTESIGGKLAAEERVLVMGTGPAGISLVREIISRPELHLRVVGFLDETGENIGKALVNPGIVGAIADVVSLVDREKVDRVVLSLSERRGRTPIRELLNLKFQGIRVEDAHTVWERVSGRIHLERLSPSWLILSEGFRKSPLLLAAKRSIDFAVASVGILLTAPIMVLVALAIWMESGKPILFRQARIGRGGLPFDILKFRSMCKDSERLGPSWAADDDRRITKVGRFIRKVRFDELPQLFNVLRGEMSLVGPRPEQPYFCKLLEEQIPLYAQRHSVRPGITGWAQINYQYGASVEESKTKLEYDLFYIKHLSVMLDLLILFETVKVMLYGRGAK